VTERCETALPKLFDQFYLLSNTAKPTTKLGSLKPATVASTGGKLSPSGGKISPSGGKISPSGAKTQVAGVKPATTTKPNIKK